MIHSTHKKFKNLAVAHWVGLPYPEQPTQICVGCSGLKHHLEVMMLPCLNVKDAGRRILLVKIVLKYHPDYSQFNVKVDTFENKYNLLQFEEFKEKQLLEFEMLRRNYLQ